VRTLVLGLSGQLGDALRPKLAARGIGVVAVSRAAHPPEDGLDWRVGLLQAMPALPEGIDTILSLGPLDAFADWYALAAPAAQRVIAIGSAGVHDKRDSPDPAERALAARLGDAEARLFAAAAARGAQATVLRPTLLYGAGRDRSLAPLVALARRWRVLPIPAGAVGLRQPVHVDDVAAAVLACLQAPAPITASVDVPGGETLPFAAMLARTLARQAPGARLWRVPTWLFRLGLACAGARVPPAVSAAGFIGRLNRDQVFDAGPAQRLLGRPLRGFDP
jgi:nucleoside-diphosphate-sugar epimerase